MKVLKNNFNEVAAHTINVKVEPYPRTYICDNCRSELEYEESDLRMGEYGYMHLECPCCHYDNMIDDNGHNITLTVDNIEFPTHFHHISIENGAVDCCDNKHVKEYLHKAIEYFRRNKEAFDWGSWITGNFYIHVHRYDGDENYTVTVSNDFYEMDIPFEEVDY